MKQQSRRHRRAPFPQKMHEAHRVSLRTREDSSLRRDRDSDPTKPESGFREAARSASIYSFQLLRMKNLLVLATAFLTILGCASTPGSSAAPGGNDGAELTAVIDAVREVIVEAETRDVAGFPALRAIMVKLQTTVSRSAGG